MPKAIFYLLKGDYMKIRAMKGIGKMMGDIGALPQGQPMPHRA